MMEGLAFQADKAILDTVFDGVAVIDLKTFKISLANNAAAEILGFDDPDELVGIDPLSYIPREDRDSISTLLSGLASGNRPQQAFEVKVLGKRGKEIWIMARGVKLASNGTSVLLASFRDVTAQKLADMALREAERKQLELLDISNEMILISQDWKVVFVNRRLQEATGLSREALTGMSILDLTHPDDRKAVTQRYQKMLDGDRILSEEAFKGIGKDGKTAWGVMRHVPFTWQGKPALMTLIQDVTEQKTAEEALRSGEERYRHLLENTNESVVIIQDWKVAYVNRKFEEIIGIPRQSLAGLHILDLTHPDDRQAVSERYQRVMNGEKYSSGAPVRGMDKDGKVRWAEAREIPFIWEGKPAVMSMMVDITERMEADEALRESERRYRLMADNITDVIWALDINLNTIYVSPSVMQQRGYTVEEAMGLTLEQQMSPDTVAYLKSAILEEMMLEESGNADPHRSRIAEGETYRKDGSRFWVEVTASFLRDPQGKPIGFMGVTRDITERKKAEELLLASEEKYRLLTEKTRDIIWTADLSLRSNYVSPSIEKVLGFTPEERLKQPLEAQMTPASYARVQARLQEELRLEQEGGVDPERTIRIETEYYHKNGSTVWMENLVSAIRDEEGHIVGVHGVSRDVTDRRLAEESTRLAAQEWAETFDSITDMVSIHDREFNVIRANQALADGLGMKLDEIKGRKCYEILHGTDVPWPDCPHDKCMKCGKSCTEELWEPRLGKYLHVSVSPLFNGRNEIVGSVHIARDITERRKTEEALRDSERRYRLLAENVEDVIYTTDMNLNLNYVSPSVVKLLGYSPQEIIQTGLDKLVTPASLEVGMRVAGEGFAREASKDNHASGSWSVELQLMRRDGRTVWVEVTTNFVRGKDGQATGLTGVVRNISERKAAQDALRESETKYRDLFEHTLLGMEVVDGATGKVVLSNHSIARMFGFKSPEDMIGTNPMEYVLPEDLEWVTNEYAKMLADPAMHETARLRARTEDGRIIWVIGSTTSFEYEGRLAALISLIDVTATKESEDKLRDSETRYRLIAENSSDVIWTMDMDLRMTYVSPSIERLTGYRPEESILMKMEDGLTPASLEAAAQAFSAGLADLERNGGKPTSPVAVELEMKCKDGSTVWTEAQMSFMQDAQGKVVGVMGVARDIDERRRARKSLEESEERFRALIEGSRDAIAVVDAKGKVIYRSPSAVRITDGVPDGLLVTSLQERLHPDDVARASRLFESLMRSPDGSVVDVELRYRRADESWGVIEGRGTNLIHDPKIGGIVVNYRDITERRQAEEAFRESESRYRLLAENVSDVIWSLNLRTRQSFFSPSVTHLLGYPVEEAQCMKMKEVISPTSYPRAMMAFSEMTARQEDESDNRSSSMQLDVELMRKDGSFVWVDISVTLLRDAEGQPAEVFAVIRDVTQRKKAEEALRTSEEYFRTLIENAWDAIVIVNAEGTMLYESPSSARILGYETDEIVGRNLIEFVRPEDVAANVDLFRRFRTEPGSTVMIDAGFKHKDGHYIECEGTLQNLLHDPKINGIVANWRDVTDRRRAEEAILASEERFRNLVEATSDWVWEVDPNGIYTYASSKACEVLGYEVSEIIGRSIFDFMPSRESNRFARTFKSHSEKKEPFAFLEASRQRKDGKLIVMETSGVPFFASDGSLLGYRGIGRDITNRKNIERELERSVKKLEKTMEAAIQAISYTMETRDPYTTGHQKRVTQLACAIAKEMGVAAWQIDGIRVAGLLHDIGKIAVPTEILSKPGKLSDIEFSMIKAHPKVGFDILKNVEFEWPIARIVVQHHERMDGSGYPYGIRGKDILQEARVLAVADVVEAMSSHRPYRAALGIEKALAEVARGEGTLYDADVVRACAKVINERGFKFEG